MSLTRCVLMAVVLLLAAAGGAALLWLGAVAGGDPGAAAPQPGCEQPAARQPVGRPQVIRARQILALSDPSFALQQLRVATVKLVGARAAYATAAVTAKEAQTRVDQLEWIRPPRVPDRVWPEEMGAAVLTRDRYRDDAFRKEQRVKLAEVEFELAQAVVEMHITRSTVRGVLRRIE